MTKQKSTKRALLLSALSLLLCVLMLIGSTFAWFTDSATSASNKIQSGTLKLDLEALDKESGEWNSIKEEKAALFNYNKWEPGYTVVKLLKVENEGNLALKWVAKVVSAKKLTKLADAIDVYVLPYGVLEDPSGVAYPAGRSLDGYTKVGTLNEFVNTIQETTYGTLNANESAYLGIALKMRESAGNEYQNLDLAGAFDIQVIATQNTVEYDSFNNQYDADAITPLVVDSAQALKNAMLVRDAHIVLSGDIIVDKNTPLQWGSYMFVANGREVTIDLNGYDIILAEDAPTAIVYLFTTANGGTLNIVGTGNIQALNSKSGVFWAMNKNDQINIYGGDFYCNGDNWSTDDAILYATSGNIDVYGGKFHRAGHWCANVRDDQGNRVCIVFHEGVLFIENSFHEGDSARIKLADGCTTQAVEIDGTTWYKVVSE